MAKTNHWLKNRSGLIKRIIIDLSLGLAASGIAFSIQGQETRVIERCLLSAIIWTAGNYITGEYNGRSLGNISKTAERIARVGASTIILGLVINILSKTDVGSAVVGTVCTIAASLSVTSRDITQRKISWIFAGSREEQELIKKELSNRSKELWIKRDQAGDSTQTGIVVGNQTSEESEFNSQELTRWKSSGREICTVSEWFERHERRLPSHLIGNNYAVERQWPRIDKGTLTWRIKRIGDLVVGLPLLIALAPVMAIAAAAVFAEDRKSPIYSQIRNGMNGKKFRIWKIRSMGSRWIIDSATGRKQASKYVTTVGRFIRKHRNRRASTNNQCTIGRNELDWPKTRKARYRLNAFQENKELLIKAVCETWNHRLGSSQLWIYENNRRNDEETELRLLLHRQRVPLAGFIHNCKDNLENHQANANRQPRAYSENTQQKAAAG